MYFMGLRIFRCLTAFLFLVAIAAQPSHAQQAVNEAVRHDRAGKDLLEKKNWKAAAAEFQSAIRLDAQRADSYIGLGIALWGSGDRQSAAQAFHQAVQVDPKSAEQADFAQALLFQQSGQADEAIAIYRRALKRNPKSGDAHNWLGVALLQKNVLEEAITEFRAAVKLKPDFVRAYNNLGSTLAQAGQIQEGIEALQRGLKYAPGDLQLRLNLGMALRSKGDAEGAIAQFRSLLAQNSESPELQYQYGQTLRQSGDLDGAIQAFEKALALSPEARESYYGLGQALKEEAAENRPRRNAAQPSEDLRAAGQAIARGDLADARKALEAAVARDPKSADAQNLLGFVLGRGGDLAGAIEKLKQAVALDPALADAHYNLGVALWYSGDRATAVTELDQALHLNPAAANVYSFRGMTCRETGDLEHARQMLERAIALEPQAPLPYFDLGTVFLRLGQLDHAIGQFDAGLNLPGPKGAVPDLDLSIGELRRSLSGKPEQAEAYHVLGRLLGASGADASQVIAAFQEAIRLRPDYAEALNSLGLVYVQAGEDEKAAAAFREAVRLRPDYADAHQNLGAVLTTSDAAGAVRELEAAVALQPGFLKAQFNLALAYEASPAHGPQKAIEQLRKLLANEPRYPRAEFILGRLLLRQGNVARAVEHLKTAVQQEPEYGEARYQLGLALSRAGQQAEGAVEIKRGRELITASENEQAASLDLAEAMAALDKGDADQAITKLQKVVAFHPKTAEPYYLLGTALAKKGQRQEAAAAFRQALEIDPAHTGAKRALAAADLVESVEVFEGYIRQGKFAEVEPLLRRYVEEHPKAWWEWYALGYSLYAQRKIGESIKALAQSLEINVNYAEAHKVLGRDLMIIGRFDAAKIEFEQGARLDPKSPEMPYNLGKLYSIQDDWADAKPQFESAIRLDSSYMEAYDGLGLALESLGDDAGAIINYKRAIELNEARNAGFVSPYVNMSALSNRTGDRDVAMDYARRGLRVNPKSDRALFQLAKALEYRGELAEAAEALNRAITINARSSSYYYVLATICRKLGKPDESRKAMEMFAKLDRESNELEQKRRDWVREGAHE